MTRSEFEREVASATGESLDTVRNRGFSLVEVPDTGLLPQFVDWDQLYPTEPLRKPISRRQAQRERAAA